MSLATATLAVADFVASAWLVAVTWTVAGEGRSAGAVYTPAVVIVPSVAFPPGTLLTLQLTAVSVVFVTVAVNVAWFPSTTDPFAGVTVTTIAGGGGGGGGGADTLPAVQPSDHAHSVKSAKATIVVVPDDFPLLCERERMPAQMQAKGQRIRKAKEVRESGIDRPLRPEETVLNQHFGAFQKASIVESWALPIHFQRTILARLRSDLEPEDGTLFQFGTAPRHKFRR
jgi:hypothetical protein